MKYITAIIIASALLCGIYNCQCYAQEESYSLVEHAVQLRSPEDESPRHVRLERTIEEAQEATGLEDPFGDEFFRQVTAFLNVEHSGSWKIQHLLNLINLLGDERAAPGLVRLIERRLEYADYASRILPEIDPNNPAIDRLIAQDVERVLSGPPYRGDALAMLHHQRADLAIENAKKLLDFAESELERIGDPTGENSDARHTLYFLRTGVRTALTIAEEYAWADEEDPEVVVQSILERRESDRIGLRTANVRTRIYQAIRRRGLVDMFAERAREEIMAEDLGSDRTFWLYSLLDTFRADIDDELRRKIDDSMAERGRRFRERTRREREAAPDPP